MKRFNPAALVADETGSETNAAVIFSPPPEPNATVVAAAAERRRQQEEQSAKLDQLFVGHYGQPGAAKVVVPHGMMAVTLSLCYDNSDSMTDYFDRHANLSPEFVLLVVKKQAETERLARKALTVAFPNPNDRPSFGWHTEKWSMGHGNYLDSSGFELPETLKNLETQYRGGAVTHGHWEIEFRRPWSDGQELRLLPHRNYGNCGDCVTATSDKHNNGADIAAKLIETKHTKTKADLFVVQLADRVSREEYERINKIARSHGGYYSSYRHDGAVPGFIFKDRANAEKFIGLILPVKAPTNGPDIAAAPSCAVNTAVPEQAVIAPALPVAVTQSPLWRNRFNRS